MSIHAYPRARGFSIVELLVVIAIITLILALLMPALAVGLEAARAAKCLSNQRQFSIGFSLFAEDNDGRLPPVYGPAQGGITPTWYNDFGINPYIPNISARLRCPTATVAPPSVGVNCWSTNPGGVFAPWNWALGISTSRRLPDLSPSTLLTGDTDDNVGIILSPSPRGPYRLFGGSDYDGDGYIDTGATLAPIRIYNGLRFRHLRIPVAQIACADGSGRRLTLFQWLDNYGDIWGP